MKEVTVLNNQSLFDISVQEYGTIEGVFEIALANGLSVTDKLTAGQKLVIPEIDQSLVQPEIVDYYRRNDIHPATGDYDLSLFTFEQQNFEDMKILFSWGYKDYDGNPMTVEVDKLHTTPDPLGRPISKHLLRIKLSNPEFLQRVKNPVLLIDRRRVRTSKFDINTNRMSAYTHPRPEHWNGRIFEIPITAQTQVIDIKNENFFRFDGYDLKAIGVPGNTSKNRRYSYADIAFRIQYEIKCKQYDTGHIGRLRITAAYHDIGAGPNSANNYVVLSYKRK